MDLLDDKSLCVVARFCDKGDSIWNMIGASDEPEIRATVLSEAGNCPGGQLTLVTKDGKMLEPELSMEISAVNDPSRNWRGPIWVKGGITICGKEGEMYETRNRVALCRCDESENMPYCDATHYTCPHMAGEDT